MESLGFIVGTGRCGSTITAQLLNAHSQVLVPHELQILVSMDNGDRLDRLARLFPDLEVIHVVRDGRDVALSFAHSPWRFDDVGINLSRWVAEATIIADWGAAHPDRYEERFGYAV